MWAKLWRSKNPSLTFSLTVVAMVMLCGLMTPFIDYDPVEDVELGRRYLDPSLEHLMGTDGQGRSIATRVLMSVKAFFFPGLIAGVIAVVFGSALGATCGYLGGLIGRSIAVLLELIDTLPRMVFLILVCTIYQPSITLIALVSSFLFIPSVATLVRRRVETLGAEDYILAHMAHGFHPFKIITYHILWLQCRALMIRQLIFVFAYVLFIETALSYLGDYGVQEPSASWGNMVAQAKNSPPTLWPWLFPAIAIIITIASLLAVGDAIAQQEEEVKR